MGELVVDECRIHFVDEGPRDALPVVLTHGAMLDHTSWAPQREALRSRCRVVSWDLPGHGASRPLVRFGKDAGGRALLALMDHLQLERAVLVGLSVGGWIAQDAAARAPGRVSKLACLATTSVDEPTLPRIAVLGLRSSSAITRALPFGLVRRVLPPLLARTPEARRHARARAESTITREDFLEFWSGASQLLRSGEGPTWGGPLLILHGAEDRVANIPEYARRWAERCAAASYAPIPGAGHLVNLDAPEAVNAALLRFICG